MALPLVCSSLKSCRGTPDQRSTRRSPDHLHHGVLGEAKVAANRTPREGRREFLKSALNGRWRLISAMYACAREGPYKIPCAIDTRKARQAGVFDVGADRSPRRPCEQLHLRTAQVALGKRSCSNSVSNLARTLSKPRSPVSRFSWYVWATAESHV